MNPWDRRRFEVAQQLAAQQAQPAELPENQESDRRHLFTAAAGVLLPIAQAAITGALAGLAAGVYAALLRSPIAWKWGIGVGMAAAVLAWAVMLWRWLDLTRPIERLTGWDLNQDGRIGYTPTIRIQLDDPGNRQTKFIELPGEPEALQRLARGLLAGAPFSEGQWSGKGAPFSRSEFRAIREELIARGLAIQANEKDNRQGYTLTPAGRAVMKHFDTPPYPNP